jgi:hypothetical protein
MRVKALAITLAFVCGTSAAAPLVTYESASECRDEHHSKTVARCYSCERQAVIVPCLGSNRLVFGTVSNLAGNVIETHEDAGDFKEW